MSVPTLGSRLRLGEASMGLGVLAILGLMIVPLPTTLLDGLLALNIGVSMLVFLVALYLVQPLDFSLFPTLLLITTLLRLGLNVASTRLILLHGNEGVSAAGHVIAGFGQFVVGGNYVVGCVVFLILTVINFVVITKGAGRVAEVAARFTLDALPGKQMSIDADLSAGLIDEREARRRREGLEREADFYGGMDGASKFVRGDAIAGILITIINLIGGFAIGVAQQGLEPMRALETYAILSVGDGLVSQIPALIISTAAGIVTTRAASRGELQPQILAQVAPHARSFVLVAVGLGLFALVPGMPTIVFLALAAGAVALAGVVRKRALGLAQESERRAREEADAQAAPPQTEKERLSALLPVDLLAMDVGYALVPLVDQSQKGDLLQRIVALRRQFAEELGIVVPSIHIKDSVSLAPGGYVVRLRGQTIARGELMPGHLLAMDPGQGLAGVPGIATREPAFGLEALWIAQENRERAEIFGYTVVDHATVIATHLTELVRQHAHELVGRQEVQELLDGFSKSHPKVVEEVVPAVLPLGHVVRVLQNLLREGIGVRDLRSILETLADVGPVVRDADVLTEHVRQRLSRMITQKLAGEDGVLRVAVLDPSVEDKLRASVQVVGADSVLAADPALLQRILQSLEVLGGEFAARGGAPVLIVSSELRRHLRGIVERFLPQVAVLSHREIDARATLETIAAVP
jgi:flagellar biosynthesis protein FlhA